MPSLTTRQLPGRSKRKSSVEGQLQPGTVLQNRYQVVGVLGAGGMGSVYQARDLRFPNVTKLCAVKEMMNLASDPMMRKLIVENFEREANILATLDHPAVPEIFDYFTEENRSYLVMEFVTGKTLEEMQTESDSVFPEEQVLDWAIQICDVLAYLHSHRPVAVIFRDIKPSNIMLDMHNRIRLIDFGIAKAFQSGERGTMIGTEGYSPPEQYRGEAGPASDVYALAATLHALLTNQDPRLEPPFSFNERPIRSVNPDISPAFEAVIMKALSYNVEDRFETALEMASALALLNQQHTRVTGSGTIKSRTQQLTTAYQISPDNVLPLWSFKCEDEIRSTPCVAEGKVVIGSYDNNIYAVDVKDGEFIWKFATDGGVASSPFFWHDRVFFGSLDGSLYAVYLTSGQKAWSFRTKGRIFSSPRADFGHVFFGSDDGVFYAVNSMAGREAWRIDTGSRIRSSAMVSEELLYFGSDDGVVHAVNLSGEVRWRFVTKRAVISSPALAEGLVVVGSQDWSVYAVDASSGWSTWRYRTNNSVVSSPAIHGGTVYIGSADKALHAIDLFSGQRRWTYEIESQITSTPLVYRDAVYFGGNDGSVYSLDAKLGELRWRFQSDGMVPGSPAAYEDLILIGSTDGKLYALAA
jgi:outer membrane protein assembly factor BamB/tRNA A-37 threonylcarbamoyl transferase component Bud32